MALDEGVVGIHYKVQKRCTSAGRRTGIHHINNYSIGSAQDPPLVTGQGRS